jgi:hypothetical protein
MGSLHLKLKIFTYYRNMNENNCINRYQVLQELVKNSYSSLKGTLFLSFFIQLLIEISLDI